MIIARTDEKERQAIEFLEYCHLTDKQGRNRTVLASYKPKGGKRLFLFVGDKIHLKNKGGSYIVKRIWGKNTVIITCKKWITEKNSGIRNSSTLSISIEMINCKYGGEPIYKEYK